MPLCGVQNTQGLWPSGSAGKALRLGGAGKLPGLHERAIELFFTGD
jgi:hypothetical protein